MSINTKFYESEGKTIAFKAEKLEDTLPIGVYDLKRNKAGFYLERRDALKQFDMYGDVSHYDRIITEFRATNDANLGVYLKGIAGAGKTVGCNYICHHLDLPVICINENFGGEFVSYLSELDTKAIIYIDEADKIFKKNDHREADPSDNLLTLLDGKYNTNFLFLLTSNFFIDNDYIYNRLGRLKYMYEFNGASLEEAEVIVDNNLKDRSHKENILKLFETIKPLTYDTIESVIRDVNIHGEDPFIAAANLCLIKIKSSEDRVKLNLHINDQSFNIGYHDELMDADDNVIYVTKTNIKESLSDYLQSITSGKIQASLIKLSEVTRLEGNSEYDFSAKLDLLDTEVYLSIVGKPAFNGKLYRHKSE